MSSNLPSNLQRIVRCEMFFGKVPDESDVLPKCSSCNEILKGGAIFGRPAINIKQVIQQDFCNVASRINPSDETIRSHMH